MSIKVNGHSISHNVLLIKKSTSTKTFTYPACVIMQNFNLEVVVKICTNGHAGVDLEKLKQLFTDKSLNLKIRRK